MQRLYQILSYAIFSLNGLLIFFWLYQDNLVVPSWIQSIGRMHPMLLHLPIGFFIIALILIALKRSFKKKAFHKTFQLVLYLTASSLVVTGLMGIILSTEGGYESEILSRHLNSGILLSLVTGLLVYVHSKNFSLSEYVLLGVGSILLMVTGHFGATLTHGSDYVLAPILKNQELKNINLDSITFYSYSIQPVLDKKCASCHNSKKKKGELILTDKNHLLKGGENGAVIVPGNLQASEMIKRVSLNVDHDDHMPPSGKPQLTMLEIQLLEAWITSGADFTSQWTSLAETDSLRTLANQVLSFYKEPVKRQYDFDFASADKIEKLNTPFRTVSQLAIDVPALKADFYLAQYYQSKDLKDLSDIKTQLLELNLAGMPVEDADAAVLMQFKNLETLNLNNTNISDVTIQQISSLPKIKKLSLLGTSITLKSIGYLSQSTSLEHAYLWNTSITPDDLAKLNSDLSSIDWDLGYEPQENEILKLTPPILSNETFLIGKEDKIILKHNLPETLIRYALDGIRTDSINSEVYSEPISIKKHTTLKTMATKPGWLASNELTYNFYVKGLTPTGVKLLTTTNKSYKAKGPTSLTDNVLGDPNNFRDGNWLGFRENNFIAEFTFDKPVELQEISLLYDKNIGSYLMPPKEVEIWASDNPSNLKLIKKINPTQPDGYQPNKIEAVVLGVEGKFAMIKIIANPVNKLPQWHSGKGDKAWLMISEIIFR